MAGLVAAVSLEGCGLFTKSYDFTEAENSIYVEDNATIRAAMISDFDKDYYSIDELAGVAQQEALSFNKNVYDCSYYSYDQMTKEEKEALNKMNIALSNIENYDGTSRGQKKVV